jgi:predicted dehydrogenase
MDTVNWGLLGASKFAREQMAPAIHAASGARLAGLATSDAAKAAGFQTFAPDVKVYGSYEALLADPMIDAVYVPLPNHLHVEWTLKALAAGKHVLTEKPISLTASEIDTIIAARDKSGLLAAEAFMIVHHPQWKRARDLVADGAIGEVIQVDGVFSYDNRTDTGNIRNRPETGGGGIRDIGVYTYGSARFVTGSEPELDSLAARAVFENDVDTWAHVTGKFTGNGHNFAYSAVTSMRMFNRQEMAFHGDKGLIRVSSGPFNAGVYDQAEVQIDRPGLVRTVERFPAANHYVEQVQAFGRSIREGAAYPCPLEFTRGTQAMIDRVFEVARPL